ncbi:MAG: peptide/nickel transport system permease protein [Gammaproteobacteria bacterium]|jgi:peptide/nickel transport system permease protein
MIAALASSETWNAFHRDRPAMLALLTLVLLSAVAALGLLATEITQALDPAQVRLVDKLRAPLSRPSADTLAELRPLFGIYLLGTDDLGRDVFARMLQGAAVSLSIGFVAMAIAVLVGVSVGSVAGYFGEYRLGPVSVDSLLMRFTDVMLCFPSFFLVLTVIALLPSNVYYIMVVLGFTGWMGIARFVRAEILSLREREFILAARACAIPAWRIITVHLLPNALGPILVSATITVAGAILTESALSFLGFGVQPPQATWGNILADGRAYIFDAPWLFFIPGGAIFTVVLAFNLVGEGVREAADPRLRRR